MTAIVASAARPAIAAASVMTATVARSARPATAGRSVRTGAPINAAAVLRFTTARSALHIQPHAKAATRHRADGGYLDGPVQNAIATHANVLVTTRVGAAGRCLIIARAVCATKQSATPVSTRPVIHANERSVTPASIPLVTDASDVRKQHGARFLRPASGIGHGTSAASCAWTMKLKTVCTGIERAFRSRQAPVL